MSYFILRFFKYVYFEKNKIKFTKKGCRGEHVLGKTKARGFKDTLWTRDTAQMQPQSWNFQKLSRFRPAAAALGLCWSFKFKLGCVSGWAVPLGLVSPGARSSHYPSTSCLTWHPESARSRGAGPGTWAGLGWQREGIRPSPDTPEREEATRDEWTFAAHPQASLRGEQTVLLAPRLELMPWEPGSKLMGQSPCFMPRLLRRNPQTSPHFG